MSIILSWDENPTCAAWSEQLLNSIQQHIISLETGQPDNFIYGYSALSASNKLRFWAEFVIKIIAYESSFDPHCIYQEPYPLNELSVGLLQLSYSNKNSYHLEGISEENKSLEDPLINIRCGMIILAYWLEKDGVVAQNAHGGARYWSVLREEHHLEDIRIYVKEIVGL